MHVLVTGGAGFIGSHTVAAALSAGHRVRILDDLSTGSRDNLEGMDVELIEGSITDPEVVARAMVGIDRVVHLAAKISVPDSVANPLAYDAVNVHGFLRVLEAARAADVQRVVYASSCAVYGSLPGLPKHEHDRLAPESPYAASKSADEQYAIAYARTMGLSTVGLRYFNVFGQRQDPSGPYGAVIPKFVERALQGRPLTIFGDGEQGRDFVHVSDVARANLTAATVDIDGHVFNVGTGRMLTVNQVAQAVRAVVGEHVQTVYEPQRPGDIRFSRADVEAAATWGFRAEADFERALEDTIRWFRDQASSER
jgi:nucleoside-diphosphate-sugar epimerase